MAGLFAPKTPALPVVAAAPPMPDPTSPSVLEAQRQQAAAAMARAGRQSTIMGRQGANPPSAAPTAQDAYASSRLGTQN
jgi:hypothetical protein